MTSCKPSICFNRVMVALQTIVSQCKHFLIIHLVQEIQTFTYILFCLSCLSDYEKALTAKRCSRSGFRCLILFDGSYKINLRSFNPLIFKVILHTASVIQSIYHHTGLLCL